MDLAPGSRAGDYDILEVIGEGGMGRVFKVRHRLFNRIEAMKVVLPDRRNQPEQEQRFLREIRILSQLAHPKIASLHTAIEHQGSLLMVMEYVEGETLAQKLARGPVPRPHALDWMAQALEALSFAHQQGVIHRDIKPSNIMVTEAGQIKLMDFGIAKSSEDCLTRTGETLGSCSYMSPEQVAGSSEINHRSDIYSLGVTFYEVLTGKRPFDEKSQYAVMRAHLERDPRPPIELDPALPADLNDIILMAMAKDPAQRFQSADAFGRALSSLDHAGATTTIAAHPAPVQASSPPPPRHSPRLLYMVLGSLVTLAVLIFGVIEGPQWFRAIAGGDDQTIRPLQMETGASIQQPDRQGALERGAQDPVAPLGTVRSGAAATTSPIGAQPEATAAGGAQKGTGATTVAQPPPAPELGELPPLPPEAGIGRRTAEIEPEPENTEVLRRQRALEQQSRDRLLGMASRANAVRRSLSTIERQQQASGYNMRRDIASAQERMERYLDQAEQALAAGEIREADAAMRQAELALNHLERFLGR